MLENIDYGVIFMGPDLRARIINKVMRDFWNFPPEFVDSKPSMRELIEFNRDAGVYDLAGETWEDWIETRVERVRQGGFEPIELYRTDGMILRHQCVALQDGGRMLTYFDITEQRNREKETERSRDAAEAALDAFDKKWGRRYERWMILEKHKRGLFNLRRWQAWVS